MLRVPAKVRRVQSEHCPWCSATGKISLLCSYAISFKESIKLCSNLQCLYPLVSRPLDSVHASLCSTREVCKRKSDGSSPLNQEPASKRQKDELYGNCELNAGKPVEDELLINCNKENSTENNNGTEINNEDSAVTASEPKSHNHENSEKPVSSTQEEEKEKTVPESKVMVPTQRHLFWSNTDNLCWLHSMLVALSHLRTIRGASLEREHTADPSSSIVRNMMEKYYKIETFLKTKEQLSEENVLHVPSEVLQKTEQDLLDLRQAAFTLLQPKLRCQLGQRETPVFALPLFLRSDEWATNLFQHVGQWEFKCTHCGYTLNTSVENTITTFTHVMSDWHPLKAVHRTQCNSCLRKNQKRLLVLQRLSSVLALHFVEGLPKKDVSKYSFDFNNKRYDVTAIIQYDKHLEHFITWIQQPGGPWLEFDDLKHPHCLSHKRLPLSGGQFHILIWEAQCGSAPQPPEQPPEQPLSTVNSAVAPALDGEGSSESFQEVDDASLDDTCILQSLADGHHSSTLDTSIGSATLLNTFEGLSQSDIISLTLVEVTEDNQQVALTSPSCPAQTNAAQTTVSTLSETPPTPVTVSPPAAKPQSPNGPSSNVSNPGFLFQQHPSNQTTPIKLSCRSPVKVSRSCEDTEGLPSRSAELFDGYKTKTNPHPGSAATFQNKSPFTSPSTLHPPQPYVCPNRTVSSPPQSTLLTTAGQRTPNPTARAEDVSSTEALRQKLLKKLKAKKKKLAKLNQLLKEKGQGGTARPDSSDLSADLCFPYTVTSSTSLHQASRSENKLTQLLSPASHSSNHSPDSTCLLDRLTAGDGVGPADHNSPVGQFRTYSSVLPEPPPLNCFPSGDEFIDELMAESSFTMDDPENALDIFF